MEWGQRINVVILSSCSRGRMNTGGRRTETQGILQKRSLLILQQNRTASTIRKYLFMKEAVISY